MKISPNITRSFSEASSSAKVGDGAVRPTALGTLPNVSSDVLRGRRIDASGPSDYDAAKVEQVRSALRNGNFRVNPEVIADGLLRDARAFVGGGLT